MVAAIETIFPDIDRDFGSRPDKIADDERRLDLLLMAGKERTCLRLWDNDRRLVIPKRLARLPDAPAACRTMEVAGWPVSVRASGGTTVAHGPGVLNVSLFIVANDPVPLDRGFDDLCRIIVDAAAMNRIDLTVGRHARSCCAGTYDIGWRGRKVAGTAGLARRKRDRHGAVFHASLAVFGDWRAAFKAICRFEHAVGLTTDYEAGDHTTLAEIQSGRISDRAHRYDPGHSFQALHMLGEPVAEQASDPNQASAETTDEETIVD